MFCDSDETSSSVTVLNHFYIMYQSISFTEHPFFSFLSHFFIYQLDPPVFRPVWTLYSLETSATFHLFLDLLFFKVFNMLWMMVTVNKAKFLLRETLISFSKITAFQWMLVTAYKIDFTSWKVLITLVCSLLFSLSTWHVMFSQTKFQIAINISHLTFHQCVGMKTSSHSVILVCRKFDKQLSSVRPDLL